MSFLLFHNVHNLHQLKKVYEYKRMCVELYRQGKWPEALQHKNQNKEWTAEQKYELVAQVLAGKSIKETAFSVGINNGQLTN